MQGTETMRAGTPLAASATCASMAMETSEPVAKIVTLAVPGAGVSS